MSDPAERIKKRLGAHDNGDCWPWPGAKTPRGYGKIGYEGRTLYVHRVMALDRYGSIPENSVVMHTCDRPDCCNPAHLSIGTPADNSGDMVAKGRSRRGEKHSLSRLSAADVDAIRSAGESGESQRSIGTRFGVSFQHVSDILNGKKWADPNHPHHGERAA